jgi:hypothetical protein
MLTTAMVSLSHRASLEKVLHTGGIPILFESSLIYVVIVFVRSEAEISKINAENT